METTHTLINGDCRKMSMIQDGSVQLIVTSPPYWQLKDYGTDEQIGFNDTYEQYINNLNIVWKECFRVLQKGCRLCINIGDQFARSVYYGRYKVIPIHAEIIRFCEKIGFDYMGSIVWQKTTNMHTTGGQEVMGSYPYPRSGIVKIDFEYILLFKKQGKTLPVSKKMREASTMTGEEWNTYFNSHWIFSGARQDGHIAVFPEELPKRLIKMFSFVGETVLDPFMGSGTTALAARNLERNSIGYEINRNYKRYFQDKVAKSESPCIIEYAEDCSIVDVSSLVEQLPYKFIDVQKLDKQVNVKNQTYGSVFEDKNHIKFEEPETRHLKGVDVQAEKEPTVLINHARMDLRKLMIKKGICYLRAGNSKGSVLVTPGFERMQYVLLHTAGNEPQLFRLKSKGKFQIWTKETLVEHGFNPQSADYYVVLHFDNKPIEMKGCPNLKEDMNTFRAKLKPLNEFKPKK